MWHLLYVAVLFYWIESSPIPFMLLKTTGIYSFYAGRLSGCFHSLVSWTGKRRCFFYILISLYLIVYPIVRFLDRMIALVFILKIFHILSHNDYCTSPQYSFPSSPHLHQHLLSFVFLMAVILLIFFPK